MEKGGGGGVIVRILGNFFWQMFVGHSLLVGQNKLTPPSRNTEVSALDVVRHTDLLNLTSPEFRIIFPLNN
jgi:hypothetical protein